MNGNCRVIVHEHNEESNRVEDSYVKRLDTGHYFGEIALLCNSFRSATVITENYVTVGKLKLETVYALSMQYPAFK
jgi:CRP-like cAMP-binding protein